jgi:hypothetical protein
MGTWVGRLKAGGVLLGVVVVVGFAAAPAEAIIAPATTAHGRLGYFPSIGSPGVPAKPTAPIGFACTNDPPATAIS